MILHYRDQNRHFGRLAITDPRRTVRELQDYLTTLRIDIPIAFHIELMMVLARAYVNEHLHEYARLAAEEVEHLAANHLHPDRYSDVWRPTVTCLLNIAMSYPAMIEGYIAIDLEGWPTIACLTLQDEDDVVSSLVHKLKMAIV
jgi:hypothetical protein